jgi:hypothetical protein
MAIKPRVQDASGRRNVVVYGAPMSGKTTWVASQVDRNSTVHIQTDGNALAGCVVVDAVDWGSLMECVDYAVGNQKVATVVLDVLDDAVAYAEARAQAKLGMSGKADAKGAYNRFTNTVGELVKESVLRPLLMSGKQVFVIMHSMQGTDGAEVPCFGTYSRDAQEILNWVKGRSSKVVRCVQYAGAFEAVVEAERAPAAPTQARTAPVKAREAKGVRKTEDKASEAVSEASEGIAQGQKADNDSDTRPEAA